ncbi:ATP-binding protein [Nocardioides sp. LHG3406-4]|uniref:ATP-binding protein n=1 Tax=Nocardioides sp. LHG3406-4 TaxID=2804575 RepID=UPI003CF8806A
MAALVRIRLSSAMTVDTPGGTLTGHELGSRKARTLLALLAASRGSAVTADRLADALWPATPPADPAANVATLVSRTRRVLGDSLLVTLGHAYALATDACVVDLDEAAGLVAEAGDRAAAGATALAAAAARRALGLLGAGPALADQADAEWVLAVRREADELRRRARHLLAAAVFDTDPAAAAAAAMDAVAADPFDERAVRELMRAHASGGNATAALTAYEQLARRLREELGAEPDSRTRGLHLALLRGEVLPSEGTASGHRTRGPVLVGREPELRVLDDQWVRAGSGAGSLVLVDGQAGNGKTRLLDAAAAVAEASGGHVLRARCRPAERSLFLQPYVDALRPVLLAAGPAELAQLVGDHTWVWTSLVPELTGLVAVPLEPTPSPAIERRRAYDAVAAVLRRLAMRRPVLLMLDDLQEGGSATSDLLGHLVDRVADAPVLLVGAVRSESVETVTRVADRATRLSVGALPPSAVEALASAAGLSARAPEVQARTAGHALSVVECLRALAAGDDGVPETLAVAVQARVWRLDPAARSVLEGASVVPGRVDPQVVADLCGLSELAAAHACEELVRCGLLVRVGTHYEFVNDLVQECVHTALPPAVAVAHHRRAADLSADRPETMAQHAFEAGDPERAAEGWLLAGRAALSRSAADDAVALLDRGLEAAVALSLRTRILLVRARAHEARTAFAAALADVDEALRIARLAGDRRLEMAALRARGGDVPVALHLPYGEVAESLETGLRLASGLGDRRAESDFSGRLAILEASELRFGAALQRARHNLVRCRAASSEDALVLALDGLKTVLAHLGAAVELAEVVDELEPLLRRRQATWLLQWTVFESSYVPAAAGDWSAAAERVEEAVELNRRSGYAAYSGFFRAHDAWFRRLAGDLDGAAAQGLRAFEETSRTDHPWWYAAAAGIYAATLLEAGRTDEAAAVARRGLEVTSPAQAQAWRLRCLAPLAVATGDEAVRAEATRLVEAIDPPAGGAWVTASDVYLLAARAWRDADPERAAGLLAPLLGATGPTWAALRERTEAELAQISSATS